jgi:methionine synthase II (cobalamin-independent)
MNKKPELRTTAIGSYPHNDIESLLKLLDETIPEIPIWPQLPKLSFYEEMNNQYSRRLPCFFIDEETRKSGFDTSEDLPGELDRFYTKVLSDEVDYFELDSGFSIGFGPYTEYLKGRESSSLFAVKGQVVGPLTHGVLTDRVDGKLAFYKPDLYDAIVKNCIMVARWQIKTLKEIYPDVIIFIDEPSLSVIGSGFYSVEPEQTYDSFKEVINAIKDEGGTPGMHCCGNADWNRLMGLGIDIINFDADDDIVSDKFVNSDVINEFVESGKVIAWGIVPTLADKIGPATIESVEEKFTALLDRLKSSGLKEDALLEQSLITPSCGTGTLSVELAEKAMRLTKEISQRLRGEFRG